jgi:superfamily II DNA or RNA helicase
MIQTGLTTRGYTVFKKDLSLEQLEDLKNDLTVTPFIPQDYALTKPTSFKIYQESNNKIYIPKCYGLKKFGIPIIDKLSDGANIDIKFDGQLRSEQEIPVNKFLEACNNSLQRGGIISVPCAFGKCLGKDTKIMLYDGIIKLVQDIKIGDKLMGDDSTPRDVLSICQGREKLYKICSFENESYIVNESHILSLKDKYDNIYDISVKEYLATGQELFGYKVPILFDSRDVNLDINIYENIPNDYKYNHKNIQLLVLINILSTYSIFQDNYYTLTLPDSLLNDTVFIARSLGYYVTKINNKLIIREQKLISKIKIIELDIGDYYGFEISGNKRFVLGDFTVTHNTTMAIYILCKLKKKSLIIVHKDFLLQQWKERIQQFAPSATIGLLKASKIDIDKDIVLGSLQSLSMKDYDPAIFKDFGFLCIDEIHHTAAEVFSEALKKVNFKYSLGLSATPKRKDGLSKVFIWHVGDIVFSITKRTDELDVKLINYFESSSSYGQEIFVFKNRLNLARMTNNICEYEPRNLYIIEIIKDIIQEDMNRKILVLTDRRNHVDTLITYLTTLNISVGPYYGGIKDNILKESETKQVIIGSFAYSSEGLDIRGLNTLILASPKSEVTQIIGRILRDKPAERLCTPLVIDIIDNFSIFPKQAKKRLAYYKKCKYNIIDPDNVFLDTTKVNLPKHCIIQEEI